MKIIDMKNCEAISGQLTNRLLKKNNVDLDVVGKIGVLIPKAICNGRVNHEDVPEEELIKECKPEACTKEGDIVMKLSSPYEACYITKEDEGLLVPSFCCIIRVPQEIVWYVMAFLASDNCRNQILKNCAGSIIAILKIGSIRNLEIPELSQARMEEIGSKFKKMQDMKFYMDEIYKWEQIRNSYEFTEEAGR